MVGWRLRGPKREVAVSHVLCVTARANGLCCAHEATCRPQQSIFLNRLNGYRVAERGFVCTAFAVPRRPEKNGPIYGVTDLSSP